MQDICMSSSCCIKIALSQPGIKKVNTKDNEECLFILISQLSSMFVFISIYFRHLFCLHSLHLLLWQNAMYFNCCEL